MADNIVYQWPNGPTIHSFDVNSLGWVVACTGGGFVGASTVWPAANQAIFIPFTVSDPAGFIVTNMMWLNGATVNGNVDVGIYMLDGAKIVSGGGTAQSGATAIQSVAIATTLYPGTYYMALASDSATATFRAATFAGNYGLCATGMAQMATAYVLPATATLAGITGNILPHVGLTRRSFV